MPRSSFKYAVTGYIFGDYLVHEMTLTGAPMGMKDIAKLLNSKKVTISRIAYHDVNFPSTKYLTIDYDKTLKCDDTHYSIMNFSLTVRNYSELSLTTIVNQMSHHEVFMRYFTTRLKHNKPEIVVYRGI